MLYLFNLHNNLNSVKLPEAFTDHPIYSSLQQLSTAV